MAKEGEEEEEEGVEVCEGDSRAAGGIIFRKAGPDLPLLPCATPFPTIPRQGLALSNRFGLTFFSHPSGFSVARTADLVQLTQKLKDKQEQSNGKAWGAEEAYNAQGKSLVDVSMDDVLILVLSMDEITLAVCAAKKVSLFNVTALLNEDTKPVVQEDIAVKDFRWNPADNDSFVMLSNEGTLLSGSIVGHKRPVTELVAAVDWSPDGQNIIYITNDMVMHITTSKFSSVLCFTQSSELLNRYTEDGSKAYVDTVRWIRKDAVVISCIQVDVNGEEIECPVFLLSLNTEHTLKVQNNVLLFHEIFSCIDRSILPAGNGPYLLIKYLDAWEIAIATCRRNIDDHIAIIGWLEENGKKEAYKFELLNDSYPRIELTASGEDNILVGLGLDQTTHSIRLPAPWDSSEEARLPPCPLLLCMTMEGRISMFSLARIDEKWRNVPTVFTPTALPKGESTAERTDHSCKNLDGVPLSMPNNSNNLLGSCRVSSAQKFDQPKIVEKTESLLSGRSNKERDVLKGFGKTPLSFAPEQKPASTSEIGVSSSPSVNKSSSTGNLPLLSKSSNPSMIIPSQQQAVSLRTLPLPKLGSGFRVEGLEKNSDDLSKPLGTSEKKSQTQASYMSEVEADFVKELERVRSMSRELDNLMEYIDCEGMLGIEHERAFTRGIIDDMEGKIRKLSQDLKICKKTLEMQRQRIHSLCDESMQVDVWRIYAQSISEQASDSRYREFWNQRKLSPEVEVKRRNILKADKLLKQEIVELEAYLQNLDLNQSDKSHKHKGNRNANSLENFGLHSAQSLYSTVNDQMIVAEHLSSYLAQQIEYMKVCLPFKDSQLTLSSGKSKNKNIFSTTVNSESPDNSMGTSSQSYHERMQTPRRTKESMDMSWVNLRTMKTTVKRPNPVRDIEQNHFAMLSKSGTSAGAVFSIPTSIQLPVASVVSPSSMTGSTFAFNSSAAISRAPSAFRSAGSSSGTEASAFAVVSASSIIPNMEARSVEKISTNLSVSTFGITDSPSASLLSIASSTSVPTAGIASGDLKTTPKMINKHLSSSVSSSSSNIQVPSDQNISAGLSVSTCSNRASSASSSLSVLSSSSLSVASMVSVNSSENSSYVPFAFALKSPTDILGTPSAFVSAGSSCMLTSAFGTAIVSSTSSNIETGKIYKISSSSGSICNMSGSSTGSSFSIPSSTLLPVVSMTNSMPSSENMNKLISSSLPCTSPSIESVSVHKMQTSLSVSTCGASGSSAVSSLFLPNSISLPVVSIASVNSLSSSVPSTFGLNSPGHNLRTPSGFGSEGSNCTVASASSASSFTLTFSNVETRGVQERSSLQSSTCGTSGFPVAPFLSVSTSSPDSNLTPVNSMACSSYLPSTFSVSCAANLLGVPSRFGPAASNGMMTSSLGDASVQSISSNTETAKPFPAFQSSFSDGSVVTFSGPVTASSDFDSRSDVNPSNEEDMEEETIDMNEISLGGFGLGSSAGSNTQKTNPFGGSGLSNLSNTFSPPAIPSGQLFRPASFSLPAAPSSPQQSSGIFGAGFASRDTGNSPGHSTLSGFGQPAQPASVQQALGSALGTFGQSRQPGSGLTGFGLGVNSMAGAGFAAARVGGGFAASATGGGFSGLGSGGAFAAVTSSGGFTSLPLFSGGQTGFGSFSGISNSSLFTQMRK